jgi:glucose/arabinose dehydrogenase
MLPLGLTSQGERRVRKTFAIGTALLASACGGGGSTPTPTPPAANQPPAFTSAAAATAPENSQGTIYTATATDPEGAPLTYSIGGGADAARFTITSGGALAFAVPPNFELPADADSDNVYRVQLRASDGSQSATLDLAVTVTNSREGIQVRRVATGFDQPVFVAAIPGDTRVFVVEKGGKIWFLDPATGSKSLAYTVSNISTDGERGLLGLTVADNYATERQAFIVVTAADGTVQVRLIEIRPPLQQGELIVLAVPHPGASNHNGGWIGYGPDGFIYVGIGDGGGSGDPGNNAQNTNSRLGKILRFDRNPDPYAGASPEFYRPAPGNPFLNGGGDPYVFAYGLRNPFRASFDNGRLLIGDVGQNAVEEIDTVLPSQPGRNFGWRFKEGTQTFSGSPPSGLTDPVSQYSHGSGPREGNSIIGGYVYRGPIASLVGHYVFADFVSGNIWSVPASALVDGQLLGATSYERRNDDFTPDQGTIDQIVSFGIDAASNLYIVDLDGDIFEVTAG